MHIEPATIAAANVIAANAAAVVALEPLLTIGILIAVGRWADRPWIVWWFDTRHRVRRPAMN